MVLPQAADYLTIGGGLTGVSVVCSLLDATYCISPLELSSCVLESRTLAGGATGRNGARHCVASLALSA